MKRVIVIFTILLLGFFQTSVMAAPGGLDYSFDTDGYVTTSFGASVFSGAYAVASQTDGKIVAAGGSLGNNGWDFALARYNTDGTLDTSFDSDGLVITDFGASDNAWAVVIQTDGKIVAAGDSFGEIQRFAIARYNSDGSLDTTFDSDGLVTTGFDNLASAAAIVLQTDGKIVLAGLDVSNTTSQYEFTLARYNTNGSLDTTFDGDGKVTTDFNSGANVINKVLIQTDGKIVAVGDGGVQGDTSIGSSSNFTLARYNTNGSLDTTFDSDGKVTTDFNGLGDAAFGAALQSDGKIIAVGLAFASATNYNFAAARYNTNGSLDITVDGDGKVTTAIAGYNSVALSIVIQTDGQIVIAGILTDGLRDYFGVVRINASLLENNKQTVGSGGTITTDVEGDGANLLDPVETTITSPNGGTITISEATATTPTASGFSALGQQVTITAPAATAANPLVLVFRFDSSVVAGANKNSIKVYKNGVQVANCNGPAGQASPDPCVSSRVLEADGDVTITVLSSTASEWNFAVENSDLPLLTGGGWIETAADGKGAFAFNVHSETSEPAIKGEAKFESDGVQFKSESIDSLMTTDTRAKYSGIGNVNGSSGYGYVVIVEDGKLSSGEDRFRIKITDADEVVVFDNAPGSEDIESSPLQAIGGGSIVIH